MSQVVSLRLPDETAERLKVTARRTGRTVNEAASRSIEEWLRQRSSPTSSSVISMANAMPVSKERFLSGNSSWSPETTVWMSKSQPRISDFHCIG